MSQFQQDRKDALAWWRSLDKDQINVLVKQEGGEEIRMILTTSSSLIHRLWERQGKPKPKQ